MLVRREEQGALVIGQLSHAWLSGQLARAWGNERFAAPEPREAIALGACQHDVGWARVDNEPRLDAESGLPRGFMQTSVHEHLEIWREAPDRLASQSSHAALVVSLHGAALSELRAGKARTGADDDAQALRAHVAAERTRQRELCARVDVSAAQAAIVQRQMWAWDGLSLALCLGWRPFTAHDVPTTGDPGAGADIELRDRPDGAVTLDPWPLAAPRVEARCEARRIGRHHDEGELRKALAAARPFALAFTLVAP